MTLVPSNVLFRYDGTLEGYFSAVFDAFALKCSPSCVCKASDVQMQLGQKIWDVQTDRAHAERLRVGLVSHGGSELYRKVKLAFLSDVQGRELVLLSYIEKAMKSGYRIHSMLADEDVRRVDKYATRTLNEREKLQQFARFEKMENGVYFACVNPNAHVLPLVMEHFAERFSTQAFLIYDEVHKFVGMYDLGKIMFRDAIDFTIPARSSDEETYRRLWKRFYDSVSNEQRFNPDLRRSNVPKRLWKNLTEFDPSLITR